MNPPLPPNDDDTMARDERELAALYRRLPQAEPDAALDARVLATAKAAVAHAHRRRLPRWSLGLASAAVVVLAAGIVWRTEMTPSPTAVPMAPAATHATDQASKARPSPRPDAERAAPPAPMVMQATPEPSPKPKPVTEVVQTSSAKAFKATGSTTMLEVAPQPARKATSRTAPRAQATGIDAAAALYGVAADQQLQSADVAAKTAAKRNRISLPAAPPPAPPAPAPSQPAPESAPPRIMQSAPAMAPAATTSSLAPRYIPDARVEHIRNLLRAGKRTEAMKVLRTLKVDYPDFVLPTDLQRLQVHDPS